MSHLWAAFYMYIPFGVLYITQYMFFMQETPFITPPRTLNFLSDEEDESFDEDASTYRLTGHTKVQLFLTDYVLCILYAWQEFALSWRFGTSIDMYSIDVNFLLQGRSRRRHYVKWSVFVVCTHVTYYGVWYVYIHITVVCAYVSWTECNTRTFTVTGGDHTSIVSCVLCWYCNWSLHCCQWVLSIKRC